MKSYTDLPQSKKLAEILPLKSADMVLLHEEPYETSDSKFDGLHQALCVPFNKYNRSWRQKYKNISYFPCWSLASLLGVIPILDNRSPVLSKTFDGKYRVVYHSTAYEKAIYTEDFDNPVDACYEMIIKLNELNML